ncbi:MAG: hypothetical protein ACHQM4_04680 [Thermoanaerobaculia bacterium]
MTRLRSAFALALVAAPLSAATVTRVVPIVLDVTTDTARYTTELTLTNDTPDAVTVSALYTPALGSKSGNGTVADNLGPGEQRRIPDVLAWLRTKGLSLPPVEVEWSQGGTLKLDFTGPNVEPARVWALARTGSDTGPPLPVGRASTSYAAPLAGEGATSAFLYAVFSAVDRTNVALVNLSPEPLTYSVRIVDAAPIGRGYSVRPSSVLEGWGWTQINSDELLAHGGMGFGLVFVSATAPVWSYAVVNDRVTNDGSFFPPNSLASVSSQLLKGYTVAVEVGQFSTEVELFGDGSPSPFSSPFVGLVFNDSIAGGEAGFSQLMFYSESYPDIIDNLRGVRGSTLGPRGTQSAGILEVDVSWGGGALVRTLAHSSSGGRFGVNVPPLQMSDAALTRAAVYGLVADNTNRSNVGVFSPEGPVTLLLELHDGLAGGAVRGSPLAVALAAHEWRQVNDILRGAGVTEGWVEVTRTSGTAGWFAYGVVNDGAYPGERTGDGAYVPMSK